MDILVSKDNKGKIRVVEIEYEWDDSKRGFVIRRSTYQYGGKITVQPEIWIFKGKVKRTVTEQVKLEYNSHLKKYQDKGYKLLPSNININDSKAVADFVQEQMGEGISDSNGFKKHMLAKQADKVATSVFDKLKYWYGSRKLDGVRCSFYYKDGKVQTASRGGGHYDYSTAYMCENPKLIKFFEAHPDIILDGELYKHGKSLQQISGAARLEKDTKGMDWLEYYIYDIMDSTKTFEERLEILHEIESELSLEFNPNKEWKEEDLRFQMVPQEKVTGWNNIQKLHDKYVSEGFEGIVIRDPSKVYNFGGRTNAMIKLKCYKDECFKVIGKESGLRGYEDMVFILETNEGKQFKAKPFGDKETKYDYYYNFEEKYLNHTGECKFFYYSTDGIPLQPSFKAFRFDIE